MTYNINPKHYGQTMTPTGRIAGTIWGSANGEWDGTIEVNFPPQPVWASAWLNVTSRDGRSAVGIRSLEFRDTAAGPNRQSDFTEFYWNWPATWWSPLMTKVTFGISIYHNTCYGGFALDFWS